MGNSPDRQGSGGLEVTLESEVVCSSPSQCTCLGCGLGPQARAYELQLSHICVSLPLSPSPPLSLKINKIFKKKKIITVGNTVTKVSEF